MRSEYAAQSTIVDGLPSVSIIRENVRKPRRYWGWNEKALALALGLFIAGTVMQSKACMGIGCFVLCFGIRPYWK